MRTYIALVAAAVALAGCETTDSKPVNFDTMPEAKAHQACLGRQTAIFSKAAGSPLEIGIIASSACNSTRVALYDALVKSKGRAYAGGYMEASQREDPKLIAGVIAKVKAGQQPF